MIKNASALEPGQVVMPGCHVGASQLPDQTMGYKGEDKLTAFSPEYWSLSLAVVGHISACSGPLSQGGLTFAVWTLVLLFSFCPEILSTVQQ